MELLLGHNSYAKCYIKTENASGGALNAQNQKSGHLDKDSVWTLMCVGLPPTADYKNSELRLPSGGYTGSGSEPNRTSTLSDARPPLQPPGLRPTPDSADAARGPDFRADACSAPFYQISSPSLCVICI